MKISHEGGGSWKWNFTDKYRHDGKEFKLIGYESYYGTPCESWELVDFNLVTGKIIIEKEFECCENDAENQEIYKRENETFFKKGITLNLQNRSSKDIIIISPKVSPRNLSCFKTTLKHPLLKSLTTDAAVHTTPSSPYFSDPAFLECFYDGCLPYTYSKIIFPLFHDW